tara:strand:- start:250 stop:570 length:321 start_codon:yes stop_codon:yes gene_type:complete
MANGILGTSEVPATTLTTLYTVPADTFSVVTLNVVNRSTAPRTVRVALSAAATPNLAEYIEYDVEILANGVLERTGLVLDATKNIVVYADSLGCSAMAFGLETATS